MVSVWHTVLDDAVPSDTSNWPAGHTSHGWHALGFFHDAREYVPLGHGAHTRSLSGVGSDTSYWPALQFVTVLHVGADTMLGEHVYWIFRLCRPRQLVPVPPNTAPVAATEHVFLPRHSWRTVVRVLGALHVMLSVQLPHDPVGVPKLANVMPVMVLVFGHDSCKIVPAYPSAQLSSGSTVFWHWYCAVK